MSLLVFTGGSQFAAISVIGAGGAAATAIANALLLAVRNGAYGLSLLLPLTPAGVPVIAASLGVLAALRGPS